MFYYSYLPYIVYIIVYILLIYLKYFVSTNIDSYAYPQVLQGDVGTGIFHMPLEFFFQQVVEPPPLSFLMRYVLVTCYVLFLRELGLTPPKRSLNTVTCAK